MRRMSVNLTNLISTLFYTFLNYDDFIVCAISNLPLDVLKFGFHQSNDRNLVGALSYGS